MHHTQLGWEMVYSLITQPASVLEGGSKSLDCIVHNITSVTVSLLLPIGSRVHLTALCFHVMLLNYLLSVHQEFFHFISKDGFSCK